MLPNCKSNFLQKKKLDKKKAEKKTQEKIKATIVQKNIRSFLARRSLHSQSIIQKNLDFSLMLSSDVSKFDQQAVGQYLQKITSYPHGKKLNYQIRLVLAFMKSKNDWMNSLVIELLKDNYQLLKEVCKYQDYAISLSKLLQTGKGSKILELSIKELLTYNHIKKIPSQLLFEVCLRQHTDNYLDIQGIYSFELSKKATMLILNYLSQKNAGLTFEKQFFSSTCIMLYKALCQGSKAIQDQVYHHGISYSLWLLRNSLQVRYQDIIDLLMKKHKQLLVLIQDQQQMAYFETRMKNQEQFLAFCDETVNYLQKIFLRPQQLHKLMKIDAKCRQNLSELISDINSIYDAKKILWVYSFLSDDNTLRQLYKQKNSEFYTALKMKLMTMDDIQFKQNCIFSVQQWQSIIKHAIIKGFQINKGIMGNNLKKKNNVFGKPIPFEKKQTQQTQLTNLSQLMNNLYKKCLRTKKINENVFINLQLDKMMNSFTFGVGARALQMMLKSFPFAFRFQTRMQKLKIFMKQDKKNYDRSLFLQDQIDQDLIVHIRRGHQFLDAYHTCMYKDLRKKYKIVFFNEQGLQQEGIDGGGIIKQFINRVLKSSFSEVFGMFYQTENNQMLPNPYSPSNQQYQFIGKIVGKAVYEGINIQYKFAEPFLNLLIGRQNTFEDLQYIDKQIYNSLLNIKRYEGDISQQQQSFTIYDTLPNGMSKVINLKKMNSEKQTIITNENKLQFIMSYSDFKCNKQLQQKTRLFRRGFLKVMKSEWLTMFSNQQLNQIISGGQPNYQVQELRQNVIFNGYTQKSQTILELWSVLKDFSAQQKSLFLHYVTSCPRPPTLGFSTMKPLICIVKSQQTDFLPTANTCMNVLRLPDYKNRENLKKKLLYAINAKAGFEFQ